MGTRLATNRLGTGQPSVVGAGRPIVPIIQVQDCVHALKALGEDNRVRIVESLLDGPLDVGEIAERLGGSKNTVSKQLRILREAGLLVLTKRGQHRVYALPETIKKKQRAGEHVIDLGCCRFQFNHRQSEAPKGATGERSAAKGQKRTHAAHRTIR